MNRADDVKVAYQSIPAGSGGSIPTSALTFHLGRNEDAFSLIKRFHYSHRIHTVNRFIGTFHLAGGLFGDCGEAVAACTFGISTGHWSEVVLARLVRSPLHIVPLSRLIKLTCIHIKRKHEFDLLVSYADWTQKHHGGIYQAASWNYAGIRIGKDGLIIDGDFVPDRTLIHVYGTASVSKLREKLGVKRIIEKHTGDGKHLYWKALNQSGLEKAKRLGLEKLQYPKPMKGAA